MSIILLFVAVLLVHLSGTFGNLDEIIMCLNKDRDPDSLPIVLDDSQVSPGSTYAATYYAKSPKKWNTTPKGIELIGWKNDLKNINNQSEIEFLNEALATFHKIIGKPYSDLSELKPKPDIWEAIEYKCKSGRKFQIGKVLGSGSFGVVRLAKEVGTNELFVIKMEPRNDLGKQVLLKEYGIYKKLNAVDHDGIPKVLTRSFGIWNDFRVMIMELLGLTIGELHNICGRIFSLNTTLYIIIQLLDRVKFLHSKNFLHRDLKPDNILTEPLGKNAQELSTKTLFLGDFGLAISFEGKEEEGVAGDTGNIEFRSRAGHEPKPKPVGRNADVESVGYIMVCFLRHLEKFTLLEKNETDEILCNGCPVLEVFKKMRNLSLTETPDYDGYINSLKPLLPKQEMIQLDWYRKLNLLLKDSQVHKIGAHYCQYPTNSGKTKLAFVLLVSKFYRDLLSFVDNLRSKAGIFELYVEHRITEYAILYAKAVAAGNLPAFNPLNFQDHDSAVIMTVETDNLDELPSLFETKYSGHGKSGFIGMVTDPLAHFAGFGCHAKAGKYYVVFIVSNEKIRVNETWLEPNPDVMRLAKRKSKYLLSIHKSLDEHINGGIVVQTKIMQIPEDSEFRKTVSTAIHECWEWMKNKMIIDDTSAFGVSFAIHNHQLFVWVIYSPVNEAAAYVYQTRLENGFNPVVIDTMNEGTLTDIETKRFEVERTNSLLEIDLRNACSMEEFKKEWNLADSFYVKIWWSWNLQTKLIQILWSIQKATLDIGSINTGRIIQIGDATCWDTSIRLSSSQILSTMYTFAAEFEYYEKAPHTPVTLAAGSIWYAEMSLEGSKLTFQESLEEIIGNLSRKKSSIDYRNIENVSIPNPLKNTDIIEFGFGWYPCNTYLRIGIYGKRYFDDVLIKINLRRQKVKLTLMENNSEYVEKLKKKCLAKSLVSNAIPNAPSRDIALEQYILNVFKDGTPELELLTDENKSHIAIAVFREKRDDLFQVGIYVE